MLTTFFKKLSAKQFQNQEEILNFTPTKQNIMLEITRIRTEKEAIIKGLKKRHFDAKPIIDSILSKDEQWRNSKTEMEQIAAELNIIAKEIQEVTKLTQGVAEDAKGVTGNFGHMAELSKQTAVESEGVAASSEEQAAAMEEITSSSIDLANMAGELRESIATFQY